MIQILLQGLKMDPLVSLHYYAPVCAVLNGAILVFTEGLQPFHSLARVGPLVMLANASVAFSLNVAAVFLISAAGGLVLTLAGVFKVRLASIPADVRPRGGQTDLTPPHAPPPPPQDILLIASSTLLFNATITLTQVIGYSGALCGLVLFKTSGGK